MVFLFESRSQRDLPPMTQDESWAWKKKMKFDVISSYFLFRVSLKNCTVMKTGTKIVDVYTSTKDEFASRHPKDH